MRNRRSRGNCVERGAKALVHLAERLLPYPPDALRREVESSGLPLDVARFLEHLLDLAQTPDIPSRVVSEQVRDAVEIDLVEVARLPDTAHVPFEVLRLLHALHELHRLHHVERIVAAEL